MYRPVSGRGQTLLALPEATTMDEDDIFAMPGLIDDMARGIPLTLPAMTGRGLDDWGAVDDEHRIVDCYTLWISLACSNSIFFILIVRSLAC